MNFLTVTILNQLIILQARFYLYNVKIKMTIILVVRYNKYFKT